MKPLFEPTTLAKPRATVIDILPQPTYEITQPPAPAQRILPPPVNDEQVAAIGASALTALKGVSTELLTHVKAADTAEFGKGLTDLVSLAKGLTPNPSADSGVLSRLLGLFSTAKERLVGQYASVEHQIDRLTAELDAKAALHLGRIGDLERLYENNVAYHQALESAGATCGVLLDRTTRMLEQEKVKASADSFDAQILADYTRVIQRLEKRGSDLERAKLLAKQVAPQIRMMQEDARSLVGSFGDIKAVTLPAWKNTFSLYMLQQEQKKSAELLGKISDATDHALRQSADLLRQNSTEIAKARNRDLVSVDTLSQVNAQLLGAVADVQRIDAEGRSRRQADMPKLQALEAELIQAFLPGKR